MEQAKTKVYQSKDYKTFKRIDGNRDINPRKVERIIKEIKAGNDILDEVPILVKKVNGHFEILDGQHRAEVAKRLGRAVHFIVHEEKMTLHNVAKVNSNQEKWNSMDFVNCYITTGNDNYKKIFDFHKTYKTSIGTTINLLHYGYDKTTSTGATANLVQLFETGEFEVLKYKEAVQIMEICKSFEAHPAWNRRQFIYSICKLIKADKCDMDVLVKKFNQEPAALKQCFDVKQYLANLEEIYNRNNHNRRTIY